MGNEQHQNDAESLHSLIVGASDSKAWANAAAESGNPPAWQRDVLAKILTLTMDQEIQYLSTAMPDSEDWDIVAFTESTVVRVAIVRGEGTVTHTEAIAFPRASLETLELVDVAPIPEDDTVWPHDLTLIGHYRSATLNLPLDKFASPGNRRELVRLLTSLLHDLDH